MISTSGLAKWIIDGTHVLFIFSIIQTLTWTSNSMIGTEDVERGIGFWSNTGEDNQPQPDNFAYRKDPKPENRENCIAIHQNKFNDGVRFHDERCSLKYPVICEPPSKIMFEIDMGGMFSMH